MTLKLEKINPHSPTPIYAQIVESMRDLIMSGSYEQGEALPSVRALSKELEVNSLTIQKAYKLLEADGLIAIKKGVGAFVNEKVNTLSKDQKLDHIAESFRPIVTKAKALGLSKSVLSKTLGDVWEEEK